MKFQKDTTFLSGRLKSVTFAVKGAIKLIATEHSIMVQFSLAILMTIAGFYFNISHEEYNNSKKEQLPVYFRGLLETIKKELKFNGRLSLGVTKAYGSITKKIPHDIPESMTPEKLAHYIEEDIITSNYHKIISSVILSKLSD